MIMSYLLFPNRRSHQLKELSAEFLGVRQTTFEELVGKGRAGSPSPRWTSNRWAATVWPIPAAPGSWWKSCCRSWRDRQLLNLYRDIEIPLVQVLLDMEWHGIGIDALF